MWQTGGVRGNLIGNVTGNASTATVATTARTCTGNSATSSSCTGNAATATTASSCSGNSATATRLQTARNITLSGDVTGSANFNGSANVTINTNLANVTVLTGTITGDGTESPSKSINYPAGFTRDNCVILTINIQRSTSKGYGTVFESSNMTSGTIPVRVILGASNILLEIRNINISNGSYPTTSAISSSVSFNYTIMLMKT